jgi:hypothetical protein
VTRLSEHFRATAHGGAYGNMSTEGVAKAIEWLEESSLRAHQLEAELTRTKHALSIYEETAQKLGAEVDSKAAQLGVARRELALTRKAGGRRKAALRRLEGAHLATVRSMREATATAEARAAKAEGLVKRIFDQLMDDGRATEALGLLLEEVGAVVKLFGIEHPSYEALRAALERARGEADCATKAMEAMGREHAEALAKLEEARQRALASARMSGDEILAIFRVCQEAGIEEPSGPNKTLAMVQALRARAEKAEAERDHAIEEVGVQSERGRKAREALSESVKSYWTALRERDEARAERDARPAVTSRQIDELLTMLCALFDANQHLEGSEAVTWEALRAHAERAGKGG